MKRILIVFETFHFSYDVVNFAIDLAKQDGSHLSMMFVKPLHADEAANYPFPNDLSLSDEEQEGKEQQDMRLVRADVRIFRDQCSAAGIQFNVESEQEHSIQHVLEQSAFADLILAHASPDMGQYSIKDLLTDTHCPVMLIPDGFTKVDHIILAFDGNTSSLQAIKLFVYLFRSWSNKDTWLVNFNSHPEGNSSIRNLTDWLHIHFPKAQVHAGTGEVSTELPLFIRELPGSAMVVMGAFSKKGFSRWFHRSLSMSLLKNTKAALFSMHE